MPVILGIESSCDETSASVCADGYILSNIIANQTVHEQYGGVVPELASRAHMQNIVPVVDAAIKEAEKNYGSQLTIRDIDAMKKSFSREVDDAQADFDQENAKVMNELGNRVMQVLDKYAKDNGYAIVMDVSNPQTSPVLFAANGIDVTDDIVSLYDKNAPSTIPTSAAPKPTAPRPTAPAAAKPPAK